jgi:hypothetical protein
LSCSRASSALCCAETKARKPCDKQSLVLIPSQE